MTSNLSQTTESFYTSGSQIHVLLVGDNDVDRKGIKRVLGKLPHTKYQVDETGNFEQAEELLAGKNYDVCLLDYHLNDRPGIEFLESINKQNPNPDVILLTDLEDESANKDTVDARASSSISKRDITPKLLDRVIRCAIHHKQLEQEHDDLAHHDLHTGLVSRTLFFNRLSHQLEKASRHHRESTILFIDIDSFKSINDEYGYSFGDIMLKQLADKFMSTVRACDTVARLWGNEFAILLEDTDENDAQHVCQKLLKSLEKPFVIDGTTLYVSASIGMNCFRSKDRDAAQILKLADQALYFAKKGSA